MSNQNGFEYLQNAKDTLQNIENSNLSLAEKIERRNTLRDNVKLMIESGNLSAEMKAEYEALIAKLDADLALMRGNVNAQTSTLRTETSSQSSGAPESSPAVSATTMTKELSEFREAGHKELDTIFAKRSPEALKAGMDVLADLATLNIDDLKNIDGMKDVDMEVLKRQMPAVRGMAGAMFLDEIFKFGYGISVNTDGTIKLKPGANPGNTDFNMASEIINNSIQSNPGVGEAIKAGLLFYGGDIVDYGRVYSDANSVITDPSVKDPKKFIDFLQKRKGDRISNPAAEIMMANPTMFTGMDLGPYLAATPYVASIDNAIKVAAQNPAVANAVNAVAEGSSSSASAKGGTAPAGSPSSTQTPISPDGTTSIRTGAVEAEKQDSWEDVKQNFKDKPLSALFTETGKIFGKGFSQITESPASMGGALMILLLMRYFTGSFGSAFKYGLMGMLGAGLYQRGKELKGNSEETQNISPTATLRTMVSPAEDKAHTDNLYKGQKTEVVQLANTFDNYNFNDLVEYRENKKGSLPDDVKKQIDGSKDAQTALDIQLKDIYPKLQTNLAKAFPEDAAKRTEVLSKITLEEARLLSQMDDAKARQMAISILNTMIASETDPQAKAEMQQAKQNIEKNVNADKNSWAFNWYIIFGTLVAGYAFWKGIGKGVKDALVHGSGKVVSGVKNKFSGRGSTPPPTPDAPDAPADTEAKGYKIPDNLKPIDPTSIKLGTDEKISGYESRLHFVKTNAQNAIRDLEAQKSRIPGTAKNKAINAAIAEHNKVINKMDAEIASLTTIEKSRPFANKAERMTVENQLNTLGEEYKKLSQERKTMDEPGSTATDTDKSTKDTDIAKKEKEITDLKDNRVVNYKIDGTSVTLTNAEALELDKNIKILKEFDGVGVIEVKPDGTIDYKITDDQKVRMNDALKAIDDIIVKHSGTTLEVRPGYKVSGVVDDIMTQGTKEFKISKIFAKAAR